jgi:uncharacterized protein YdhG (YjbR/CyaY superfamily)
MDLSKKMPMQRIGEDEQLLEKIMLVIPGFRGYKAKEQRRQADKIVRDYVSARLQDARNMLQDVYAIVAENKASEASQPIDRLMAILDRVSEKVHHASYGYAGFFDATKIDEDDLDRMIGFDTQLVDGAKGLAQRVQAFKDEVQVGNFDNLEAYESELRKTVEGFETSFDQRKDVIEGVEVG